MNLSVIDVALVAVNAVILFVIAAMLRAVASIRDDLERLSEKISSVCLEIKLREIFQDARTTVRNGKKTNR